MREYRYDAFISYARDEDGEWVRENIHKPLLRCRTADNRVPSIFLDVASEGLQVSDNWIVALADAIQSSRKIIPVYSPTFFAKQMCQWELTKALELDPFGRKRLLNPVVMQRDVLKSIPFHVDHIQCLDATEEGWFKRLCAALQLTPSVEQTTLRFLDTPPHEIAVNHTWPRLRVALACTGSARPAETEVSLKAEAGELRGTLTVHTTDGVAAFADLSLGAPTDGPTRLVASACGCDEIFSKPFAVVVAPPPPPSRQRIRAHGEAIFFAQGESLAVLCDDQVTIWDGTGHQLGEALRLDGRPRLLQRKGEILAIADWSGGVHIIRADGHHSQWSWGTPEDDLMVPGGLVVEDEGVLVGFWSGAVFRWTPPQEPRPLFVHKPGVQALDTMDGRLFIAGLDGKLTVYQNDALMEAHNLELVVHLLRAFPAGKSVVAVGNKNFYHFNVATGHLLTEETLLSGHIAVLGDTECPVIVDEQGRGLRTDSSLACYARFHASPGSRPICADLTGQYTVLANPDGSHVLLDGERIVFAHLGSSLAVAPAGNRLALGDDKGIHILEADDMEAAIQGEVRG